MNRKNMALSALGLAAVAFVAVNIAAQTGLRSYRFDLTEDRLYTLSPGTLKVLSDLKEPVTLRFFFSDKLSNEVPSIRTYGTRVRELLQEYAERSNGKINLQVVDPEPFSEAEDRATAAGVSGVPLDSTSGRQFYFGLTGSNTIDKRVAIPFFQQERETFLEYDVTKLVYELGNPDKPVVSILTDIPLEYGAGGPMGAMRGQSRPYAIMSQLKSFFEVRTLAPATTTAIDDKTRVLIVARPKNLSDATLYAIDQYVMRGGNALFLVDPLVESDVDPQTGMPPENGSTAIPTKLFNAWGIDVPTDRFVADPRLAISINAGTGARKRAVPYPVWLAVGDKNHDATDVVTTQLGTLNLASVGSIKLKAGATAKLTPLLTSSNAGQMMENSKIGPRPDPEKLFGDMKAGGETMTLAARVSGSLKSAFAEPPKAADPAKFLKESAKPANLIVVADSDMIEDRFWAETQQVLGQPVLVPFAANGDLIVNAVENLTGGAELNGLRGRAGSTRPFVALDELRRAAGEQMGAREQELSTQLRDAERQLSDLQSKAKKGSSTVLSPEERDTIERFRADAGRIRKELRDVQHTLNRDIDSLSAAVKAINIVLVPLIVAFAAFGLAWVRARRRALRTRD